MKAVNKLPLLVAFVLAGCNDIIGLGSPLEFPDAVKYSDMSLFVPLWEELKACSKLDGNLRSVGFYHVPQATLPSTLHGIRTVGMYLPGSNRIFIVDAEMSNGKVIRHEMMHALLRDESGHPPRYFGYDGLCGYV